MQPLKWTDADEIALRLSEKFPDVDPIAVRFTDLHRWVTELDGFADNPQASAEGILEAVQMAWVEKRRDST